jgi:hypothetical protein
MSKQVVSESSLPSLSKNYRSEETMEDLMTFTESGNERPRVESKHTAAGGKEVR